MSWNRQGKGVVWVRAGLVGTLLLTLLGCAVLLVPATGTRNLGAFKPAWLTGAGAVPDAARRPAVASLAQLPMFFEPNVGQTDARARFLARGRGYSLFLTRQSAVLHLQPAATDQKQGSVLKLKLVGANPQSQPVGERRLPGRSNYYLGNRPEKWLSGVPQFAQVRYGNIYQGVDLLYYGREGKLEHDFVLAPGANSSVIRMAVEGANTVAARPDGSLALGLAGGHIRLEKPQVYQRQGREKIAVEGRYVILGRNRVGFELGSYDHSRELVIDPVLTYSSYLGGSGSEVSPKVAVDSGSNIYVAGSTGSADFPGAGNSISGSSDAFIAKLNPAGTSIVYATYLGGSGAEAVAGISVDPGFNAYVAGTTGSSDFPTTSGAFKAPPVSAGNHVFVSKLDPAGANAYSTYLAGTGSDAATGIASDSSGNAYVTGTTTSSDFPTTAGVLQATSKAASQFFVSKINPALSGAASLVYSTYLGGSVPSSGTTDGGGIAVDSNGNAYVTGGTTFTDMPVVNALQPANNGGKDVFVGKLNNLGTQLTYFTYLGGSGDDIGNGIAVDTAGNAYVTGVSASANLPTSTGLTTPQGGNDAFVLKLNNPASGSVAAVYLTALGGSGNDAGLAIAVDGNQNAYVTGSTTSTALAPRANNGFQTNSGGGTDAFVARFDTSGANQYTSFLGGSATDQGTGIAVDAIGNTYVAGETASANFPTQNPFQGSISGPSDAFVTKIGTSADLSVTATATPNPVGAGNQVTFSYKITNNGPESTTGVTFTSVLPTSGATFTSATASPGNCTSPTGTPPTVTCALGFLAKSSTANGTVTIIMTPTGAGTLGSSGTVGVATGNSTDPNPGNNSASATTTVADYSVSVDQPSSVSVTAGQTASYTIRVTPNAAFPNSISLACASGLPTGAKCEKFTTNPIPAFTNTSPVTSVLSISTTAPPTTARVNPRSVWQFALWLPLFGVTLLGASGRRKRVALLLLLVVLLAMAGLQVACGNDKKTTPSTGNATPPGTYDITINGTSGSFVRSTTVTLVVQ